jgi:hypothetical protein
VTKSQQRRFASEELENRVPRSIQEGNVKVEESPEPLKCEEKKQRKPVNAVSSKRQTQHRA